MNTDYSSTEVFAKAIALVQNQMDGGVHTLSIVKPVVYFAEHFQLGYINDQACSECLIPRRDDLPPRSNFLKVICSRNMKDLLKLGKGMTVYAPKGLPLDKEVADFLLRNCNCLVGKEYAGGSL